MADYGQIAVNSMDAFYRFIQWFVFGGIVVGIVFFIIILKRYKHKFRIREVIGGKTIIIDDKAREIKDNEGVTKWKLFKRGHKVQPPPKEAIHITNKGKYSVEAYYLPEGEYKFVLDNGVDTKKLTHFEPIDTADREFYASEMKEAESYKQKKWTDYILPVAGIVSVMMIFILMLVFWEDIAKPGITITQTAAGISEQQYKTAEILRDVIQNRQTIPDITFPDINKTKGG